MCHTTTSYDGVDNTISASDGEGKRTDFSFDGAHRQTSRSVPRDSTTRLRTDTVYDADGNVTDLCPPREFAEPDGAHACTPTGHYSTHRAYTAAGAVKTETVYRDAGAHSPSLTSTTTHDADGNVTAVTDANGHTTTDTFDLQRRHLTSTSRDLGVTNTTTWTYDNVGNVTAVTKPGSPANRVTAYSYDTANRPVDTVVGADSLVASAAGASTGTANARTRQFYDADGNVVAILDPRAFTAPANPPRRTTATSSAPTTTPTADPPRNGCPATTTRPPPTPACQTSRRPNARQHRHLRRWPARPPIRRGGVRVSRLTYDPAGNRSQLVLPTSAGIGADNKYVAFTYTDDNLLATASAPSPVNGAHAPSAPYSEQRTYDAVGRQRTSTDALNHTTSTTYNDDGTVQLTTDGALHATTYGYDANGNKTTTLEPDGSTDATTYTADNRVATTANGGGDTTVYTYDNVGNPRYVSSPSATAHDYTNPQGTPTENTYFDDNLLRATFQPVVVNATPTIARYRRTTYTYDGGGRKLTQNVATVDGSKNLVTGGDGGTQTFTYAPNDRLTSEQGRGGSAETITSTYDAAGNRTATMTPPAAAPTSRPATTSTASCAAPSAAPAPSSTPMTATATRRPAPTSSRPAPPTRPRSRPTRTTPPGSRPR